jgi:hypothetical protein
MFLHTKKTFEWLMVSLVCDRRKNFRCESFSSLFFLLLCSKIKMTWAYITGLMHLEGGINKKFPFELQLLPVLRSALRIPVGCPISSVTSGYRFPFETE